MKEKTHCHKKLCAFRCFISRPQILILRSLNQIRGKLLLSRKLRHFSGSLFSQCFKLPTATHYSLPSNFVYVNSYFESLPIVSTAFKKLIIVILMKKTKQYRANWKQRRLGLHARRVRRQDQEGAKTGQEPGISEGRDPVRSHALQEGSEHTDRGLRHTAVDQ